MIFTFDAAEVGPWVCEKIGGSHHDYSVIGVKDENGTLIAGMLYEGFTGSNVFMHSRCDDPAKVPKKFFSLIFDYPFNQLKVKRVSGIVNVNNHKAIRVDEHLGFKREHILRDYFPDGDAILYVMRREDCRFLEKKYGREIVSTTTT